MRQIDIPVRNVKQPTVAGSSRRDQLVATLRQELASKDTKIQRMRKRPAGIQTKRKASDLGEAHVKRQAIAVVDTPMRSNADSGAIIVPHLSEDQFGAQMTNVKLKFFDPPTIFKNLLQSDIFKKDIKSGPGHFVDIPSELYHSRAWTSSNRASQGIFPYLSDKLTTVRNGDFVS